MPELPEVETVARGLRAHLPGRRILGVRLGKTDFIDDPASLEARVPGTRILAVHRHGKFLEIELAPAPSEESGAGLSLLVHLGMTGQLTTRNAAEPVAPHTHAFFALDDGRELRFTDSRRFGRMLVAAPQRRDEILGVLGFDALAASEQEFRSRLEHRRARIKALLLDQRVFRGMGNIYTDESLWRAHLHPARIAAALRPEEIGRLHRAVQAVLTAAIRLGGSSISDYVNADGEPGEFQIRHRVYQREGKNCSRCRAIIRRVIVAGRSSYFCPRCQPPPRARRKPRRRAPRRKLLTASGKRQRLPRT